MNESRSDSTDDPFGDGRRLRSKDLDPWEADNDDTLALSNLRNVSER